MHIQTKNSSKHSNSLTIGKENNFEEIWDKEALYAFMISQKKRNMPFHTLIK